MFPASKHLFTRYTSRFGLQSSGSRRIRSLTLIPTIGLLAVGIFGCGRNNTASDTAPAAITPSASSDTGSFKVALVMSGPTSDNGWNAGAKKALDSVQKELNLDASNVSFVESQTSASQQDESLRAFAQKGYNLVFGHGTEYEELAKKIEKDFPNTVFVISSGAVPGTNTSPIILKLQDGAYLEGMLAAGMSKTGKLACVGAEEIPPVKAVFEAFAQGAKAINPKIIILPAAYTGSWDDPIKANKQTLPLIEQGADIIMQDVDAAAQGVFNAVSDSAKAGKTVYALGTNNDQNAAAPDVILASAPIYIDKAFVPIAKSVRDKTFKPSATIYDMKSGVIGFVLNPQLEGKIPADLKAKIADAQKKIFDGSLDVTKAGP